MGSPEELAGSHTAAWNEEAHPLEVRFAVQSDASRLADLLGELGYRLSPEQVERGMREPGTSVLVAALNADVVGLLALHTRRHFQRAAQVSSIDALVVGEPFRSKGVGAALVQRAVAVARDTGSTLVDLNSGVRRVEARRFYEALGFEVVSHHLRREI